MARSSIGWRRSATRNTRADQRSEDGGQRVGWLRLEWRQRVAACDARGLEISSGSSSLIISSPRSSFRFFEAVCKKGARFGH